MTKFKFNNEDTKKMIRLYTIKRYSADEIAKEFNTSGNTILRYLKNENISPSSLKKINHCEYCNSTHRVYKCRTKGKHYRKFFCKQHRRQMSETGNLKKITINTPNEIIIIQDYAEVILRDIHCNNVAKAIIDKEDILKIAKYKWHLDGRGYVKSEKIGSIHRYLLNATKEQMIDHRNRNKLDNRKRNLRFCSKSQNNINTKLYKNNTYGVKGICRHHKINGKKWQAKININKKVRSLGYFDTKEEAITARITAEKQHYGEFRA